MAHNDICINTRKELTSFLLLWLQMAQGKYYGTCYIWWEEKRVTCNEYKIIDQVVRS